MTPARREQAGFWLRFAFLFGISWVPIPWLPDAYSTAFAAVANGALAVTDLASSTRSRVHAPQCLRMVGSWKPALTVDGPGSEHREAPLNVKTFSFRPLAMFLALALASTLEGRRRKLLVIGGGAGAMLGLGTLLTLLPPLTELAVRGQLGDGVGLAVETSYVVLLTPLMVYLVPLLVWWLFMWRTSTTGAPAREPAAVPGPA